MANAARLASEAPYARSQGDAVGTSVQPSVLNLCCRKIREATFYVSPSAPPKSTVRYRATGGGGRYSARRCCTRHARTLSARFAVGCLGAGVAVRDRRKVGIRRPEQVRRRRLTSASASHPL